MSATAANGCCILQLPPEILQMTLKLLTGKEFKVLRLSCKKLEGLAVPYLFQTLYLYPHLLSFQQCLELSQNPRLGRLVLNLHYDLRWTRVARLFASRLHSVYSVRIDEDTKIKALQFAREFEMQTLHASSHRDNMVQLCHIEQLFSNLPALIHIKVSEDDRRMQWDTNQQHYTWVEVLPYFYNAIRAKTCGMFPETDLEPGPYSNKTDFYGHSAIRSASPTYSILLATRNLQHSLVSLEATQLSWVDFLGDGHDRKNIAFFGNTIAGLQRLGLSFSKTDPAHRVYIGNLGLILSRATQLVSLELDFDHTCVFSDSNYKSTSDRPSLISELHPEVPENMKRICWSQQLRHMHLSHICFTEIEIEAVLQHSSSSLTSLVLGDLTVSRNKEVPAQHGCLMRVMDILHEKLKLREIRLEKAFTNCGQQLLYIPGIKRLPEQSILAELYRYILHKGPRPLDAFRIPPGADDLSNDRAEEVKARYADDPTIVFGCEDDAWKDTDSDSALSASDSSEEGDEGFDYQF